MKSKIKTRRPGASETVLLSDYAGLGTFHRPVTGEEYRRTTRFACPFCGKAFHWDGNRSVFEKRPIRCQRCKLMMQLLPRRQRKHLLHPYLRCWFPDDVGIKEFAVTLPNDGPVSVAQLYARMEAAKLMSGTEL